MGTLLSSGIGRAAQPDDKGILRVLRQVTQGRLLLGLAYVLFVPGYALQAALFPRAGDLDGPERLALSFGLSVAVVPLLALVLDRLPWGIRLWPIVAGEGLIIALWAAVAVFRRRRLAEDERPVLVLHVDARGWWAGQDRTGRVLYGVLAATVFGVGIGSFLYAVATKAFRWEHFVSAQDMFRHIIGGVLMGFGGVTAMGCTIGQGITGFSTLSIGSIITFIAIVVGASATMKYEFWRMMRAA